MPSFTYETCKANDSEIFAQICGLSIKYKVYGSYMFGTKLHYHWECVQWERPIQHD